MSIIFTSYIELTIRIAYFGCTIQVANAHSSAVVRNMTRCHGSSWLLEWILDIEGRPYWKSLKSGGSQFRTSVRLHVVTQTTALLYVSAGWKSEKSRQMEYITQAKIYFAKILQNCACLHTWMIGAWTKYPWKGNGGDSMMCTICYLNLLESSCRTTSFIGELCKLNFNLSSRARR